MPSLVRLMSLARVATMPETRRVVAEAVRSGALTDVARRARSDRPALIRDLADPRFAVGRLRRAIRHPAARELANVGLLLLPGRYLPLGLVVGRLSRRFGAGARRASEVTGRAPVRSVAPAADPQPATRARSSRI
jgi:hypothetical protein